MFSSFFRASFVSLTLAAFLASCSGQQESTAPVKKKSSNSTKKPVVKNDDDAESEDEGNSSDDGSEEGDESEESEEDDSKSEGEETDKPMTPVIKDPVVKDPVVKDPMNPEPPEVDPKTYFSALDNFRWEMLCEKMDGTEICFSNVKVDQTKTVGGKASELFEVEFKFRGVVEPMKYKGGMKIGDRFYVGGTPDDPTYNIYSIEVSSPKQIYYLNWAQATGHDTFAINYNQKIKINGGATVRLIGNGQNDKMIANFKNAVAPDVEKLPNDNKGQFIQMNIVGAALSK